MNDKERLEELKEWFNNNEEIHEFQIEWLIQQAEKVERLEMELQIHKELYDQSYSINTSQNVKIGEHLNKIRRYEQALKETQQKLCLSVKPHLILKFINKFQHEEYIRRKN